MKKLFLYMLLGLLFCNNSNAALFKPGFYLFGIKLNGTFSSYEKVACYVIDNIKGQHNGVKINTELLDTNILDMVSELADKTLSGSYCVKPKIKNTDFFNYEVSYYPDSKKIHTIEAVHRKVFSRPLAGSGCIEHRDIILQAIIDSKSKKGFKYSHGYNPSTSPSIQNSTYLKKYGYEVEVEVYCDYESKLILTKPAKIVDGLLIELGTSREEIKSDYFLKIRVSDYSYEVYQEEKAKTKKKILQKTDTDKSGL